MILASRLLPESSLRQTAIAEPLARVFARAQGGERDKLDRERADPGSLLVLRRVIEERGRVEERMPPVVMSHPRSSDAHARGRESETVISQSPRGPRVGAPGMAQNPSLANLVDLDRLTDQVVRQIDSRIVAHRERTGNLF